MMFVQRNTGRVDLPADASAEDRFEALVQAMCSSADVHGVCAEFNGVVGLADDHGEFRLAIASDGLNIGIVRGPGQQETEQAKEAGVSELALPPPLIDNKVLTLFRVTAEDLVGLRATIDTLLPGLEEKDGSGDTIT